MLATLLPLFDSNISVKAYSLFSQKKNLFENPSLLGTGVNDGAGLINGLDIIDSIGIDNLVADADVFVPISDISIFSDIESQCSAPPSRLVLLIDKRVAPTDEFINRIKELKDKGFRFAIRKLVIADFEPYRPILGLMDYILLNHRKIIIGNAKIYFSNIYPNIKLVACGVDTMEDFEKLTRMGGYSFYEGDFYRSPITQGASNISPVTANYIKLLNIVNAEDFDLSDAADIIGQDTALVLSLLEMVNHISVNSEITSVKHAAAMLGQKELKKWITTAITTKLCKDKPGELTRVSLLRAKFMENLAPTFELAQCSSELFMTGLFSVLDSILDKPMKEALELISVSKEVSKALTERSGPLSPVYDFIRAYEIADWTVIDKTMLLNHIEPQAVYDAYIQSLEWFRDIFR